MMPDSTPFYKIVTRMGLMLLFVSMQPFASAEKRSTYQLDVEGKAFTFSSAGENECHSADFLYPFSMIAEALSAEYQYDPDKQLLTVIRAPDKAVFTLAFKDGLVTVNGQTAGYVPNIDQTDSTRLQLNQPAIEVLTGTHISCDVKAHSITITLDKRLKPQFGFSMVVDGRPLASVEVLPRSIGSVLLLPIKPIIKQLDQQLRVKDDNSIEVYRTQDSVTFSLNLQSGLVKMNGTPIGITPNMSYARQDQLLLPSNTIETLTGTHITIIPGENKIQIDLDERLTNRVLPSEDILKQAANTSFVLENLDFSIGNQSLNTFVLSSHFHQFNTRLRYEVPDFPRNIEQLEPSWVSMEFDSLSGYSGSLGDYSSKHRELREIGVSRVRGLSLNTPVEDGWVIGVLGMPLVGSRSSSDTDAEPDITSGLTSSFTALRQSRPQFDGFAAGIRFIHNSQRWEAGLSARDSLNGDSVRLVSNVFKTWQHTEGFFDQAFTSLDMDLGLFAQGNEGPVDTRLRLNHSLKPTAFMRVNVNSDYLGVNFENTSQANNSSKQVSDQGNSSLSLSFNLPHNTGLNLFGNWSQTGLRTDYIGNTLSYGANLALRPFKAAPWTSISYSRSLSKTADKDFSADAETASIWANQHFNWWHYAARFEYDFIGKNRLASLNLSHQPLTYRFQKQAAISANAIATGVWNNQSGMISTLGGHIHMDSGYLLGDSWKMGADFTRYQPLPSLLVKNNQTESDASNFISLYSNYRLTRDFNLGLVYSHDFEQEHTFKLNLKGHLSFNSPRRYKNTLQGKGILKGRLFIDKNGDGIFQANEKPLSGVILSLEGTRLALKTDSDGYYTIANLPTGSFKVNVDEQQLPLGLIRESAYIRYATVGDGQITEYDIPMIRSGQITGRVFIDANDNGKLDRGEKGVEGVTILLHPGTIKTVTTAFGQYAFDELSSEQYKFKLVDTDVIAQWSIRVTIDTEDQLLHKINIPVKREP